jgi:hypothetical protein
VVAIAMLISGGLLADGASAMELDAEPNAMGFYQRMGAARVGVTASTVVPGRGIPRMRLPLHETGRAGRRTPR